MGLINDPRLELIARAMDVSAARHRVVATNIANVNTPGYRARTLSFEDAFKNALRREGRDAALQVRPEIEERKGAKVKSDGNSVHLESEFGAMQKNQLAFNVYAQVLRQKMNMMRRAIGGGR